MCKSLIRHLILVCLILLSACARDLTVSTVLDDTGGLRPGDKVYLASAEVGAVDRIEVTEMGPGFTVDFHLYPEHAGLVQSNAVAHVPLKSPPTLVLLNPTDPAPAVAPGGRLKGLSPLGVAIWQANEAAAAASDVMEEFAQEIDDYLESEEYSRTRDEIDAEVSRLVAESKAAAERIAEEFRLLAESLMSPESEKDQ